MVDQRTKTTLVLFVEYMFLDVMSYLCSQLFLI